MRAPDCRDPSLKYDWYMGQGGQGGQGRQGIQAYARSEVCLWRRSNHQYGKQDRAQDRAHMRLDKRRPGLAFGSPASRRCAASRFQICRYFQ